MRRRRRRRKSFQASFGREGDPSKDSFWNSHEVEEEQPEEEDLSRTFSGTQMRGRWLKRGRSVGHLAQGQG